MRLLVANCLMALLVAVSGAAPPPPQGNAAASQEQRVADAEQAAIGALRAMNSAQASFRSACGQGLYAPGLVELGKPAVPGGEGFLTPALTTGASVTKDGYTFKMASSEGAVATFKESCNGVPLVRGYYVTAMPVQGSGGRYFGTNTKAVIVHGHSPLRMTDQSADGAPIK